MESKIVSITIRIGVEEITLPFEDAKRLYEELKTLFEPKPTISVSSVWESSSTGKTTPWTFYPYTITYSDEHGTSGVAPVKVILGNTN